VEEGSVSPASEGDPSSHGEYSIVSDGSRIQMQGLNTFFYF
jgi:hypothetical protein